MKKLYPLSLNIFHRDLRLDDNSSLIEALKQSEQVIPCFIFDSRQIDQNSYMNNNSTQFMANSLNELALSLSLKNGRLYFFYGNTEEIINSLISTLPINAIYQNRDYTPFSRDRDNKIKALCQKHSVDFHSYADALLHEPEDILKQDGKPYTIFTPAFRKSSTLPVRSPMNNHYRHYYNLPIPFTNSEPLERLLSHPNLNLIVRGGRKEACDLLKKIVALKHYDDSRDYPYRSATTLLSAHIKFGTVSPRECYAAILKAHGRNHTLIKQLYWRDFFTHIAYHFPHVFGHAFHQAFDKLPWSQNENHFEAWCDGKTGFPIVDAGMRELNTTGYMHNRVRMITASFLTKDLHIDWRQGEKYFATRLVDYDPAVNNGNWQWAASTGCDAQPYFRIFNPWLQQAKFDPDCLYIKRWVPELATIPNNIIHTRYEEASCHIPDYPPPIVSHAIESKLAKQWYKQMK